MDAGGRATHGAVAEGWGEGCICSRSHALRGNAYAGLFTEISSGFENPFFACGRVTSFAWPKEVTKKRPPRSRWPSASFAAAVFYVYLMLCLKNIQ